MSEYVTSPAKGHKVVNLTPDAETGALFTFEDALAVEVVDSVDLVEELIRERAAYEQVLRGQGRTEERIHYLLGRSFGSRIARLAISHDVTRLLPPEQRVEYEEPVVYRDARSAAANDRLDD
jgi:hypothetical protein